MYSVELLNPEGSDGALTLFHENTYLPDSIVSSITGFGKDFLKSVAKAR